MIPGLQIIFEQPAPAAGVSWPLVERYVFEDSEHTIAAYYQPPRPRLKDLQAFSRDAVAIAAYHATEFHPRCIQAIGDAARRMLSAL